MKAIFNNLVTYPFIIATIIERLIAYGPSKSSAPLYLEVVDRWPTVTPSGDLLRPERLAEGYVEQATGSGDRCGLKR